MDAADILRMRLHAQLIEGGVAATPCDVVSRLLAVQAQDYPGATWAIGLRLPGSTLATIEQAVAERRIVRTWPMRGTLHFVAAEDVRWMLALLPARAIVRAAAREGQLGLAPPDFARSRQLFVKALEGGRRLTRPEAMALLESGGISTPGQRGYHILARLSQEGLLVLGPMEGKQQTFALLDEWLPTKPHSASSATAALDPLPREEALARLARRFFSGHGPATVNDLARWADLPKSDAKAALAGVTDTLESAEYEGARYWFAPEGPEGLTGASGSGGPGRVRRPEVHLLPGYDEYVIAYADRALPLGVFAKTYSARIGRNGVLSPTIVVDGKVVGVWKRATRARSVTISLQSLRRLTAAERRGVAEAAERYGRFVGLEATVEESVPRRPSPRETRPRNARAPTSPARAG